MKERKYEKIGGGYFVFRRGKKTGRISVGSTLPFEHPIYKAAAEEAERLSAKNSGETFQIFCGGMCVRDLDFVSEDGATA